MSESINSVIQQIVTNNAVVLFMKGTKTFPQCGFSKTVVDILNKLEVSFLDVDVLKDEALRQGIKIYSDWPTIPQLYVKGEFIGGCDIVRQLNESNELHLLFGK